MKYTSVCSHFPNFFLESCERNIRRLEVGSKRRKLYKLAPCFSAVIRVILAGEKGFEPFPITACDPL